MATSRTKKVTEATVARLAAVVGRAPKAKTFSEEFSARIRLLEARAHVVGLDWSKLCRATGAARATPDRWLRRPPKTILMVDAMEAEVAKAERAHAKGSVE